VSFTVLIPARYASTRLPGKPLADIAGKPLVIRVADRAQGSGAERVVIATDDPRILAAAKSHSVEAVLTRADHPTGTDRLAEASRTLRLDDRVIVVNVQGDEPLLEPELIRGVAEELETHPDAAIATACHLIDDPHEAFNPHVVKVVLDHAGYALYFSRATAPANPGPLYHHVGLYAYRRHALERFVTLPPGRLEQRERLEQLRALEAGMRIDAEIVDSVPLGVDTPDDLERARAILGGKE